MKFSLARGAECKNEKFPHANCWGAVAIMGSGVTCAEETNNIGVETILSADLRRINGSRTGEKIL